MKNHVCRVDLTLLVLALAVIKTLAQSTYEPYTFTTVAGGGGLVVPEQPGTAAQLSSPGGVAVDSAANVYVP